MVSTFPRYTVDMLDALPAQPGVRYELVDGVLLVTPAPGSAHGVVAGRLISILRSAIPERVAYISPPGEVRVGRTTSLVPDVLVYPSHFQPGTAWADIDEWLLAIEIVSPSSAIYDRDHKRRAYLAVGVLEYWVVDPAAHVIEVWHPGDETAARVRRTLRYRTPDGGRLVELDIAALFRDVPRLTDE
ncbi:MAG TPA: Uma2 family endonuclease [Gemmatimonadaceae bacterium]|jgi:Uma2 family endonuclease